MFLRRLSIRNRILVFATLTGIFALALFGAIGMNAVQRDADRALDERLQLAQLIALHVDDHVAQILAVMKNVAQMDGLDPANGSLATRNEALATLRLTGFFSCHVSVTDQHGIVLASEPNIPALIGSDLSDRPHIAAALQTGEPQISNHYACPFAEIPNNIAFTVPIKNKRGEILGLLNGVTDPSSSTFQFVTGSLPAIEEGHLDIIDSNGIILAGTDGNSVGKPSHHSGLAELIILGQPAIWHNTYTKEGQTQEDSLLVFAPLQNAKWGLIIAQPERVALARVSTLQYQLVIMGLALAFIAIIATFLTAKTITDPIHLLLAATRRLADGDLSTSLPVTGSDELAELGRGFEQMRDKLASWGSELEATVRIRTAELTTLFDISTALRNVGPVDKIFATAITKTMESLQAETGVIFQYDQHTNQMVIHAAQGQLANLLGLRMERAEGICGHVAQTRALYSFPNLATDLHTSEKISPLVRGVKSGMCVPLEARGQLVGALMIACYHSRSFTDSEEHLLIAIADMVAMAVHRAGLFEELEHRVKELDTLFDIGKSLTSTLNIQEILSKVVISACRAIPAEGCWIHLWDEKRKQLVLRAVEGFPSDLVGKFTYQSGEGLTGWVFRKGKTANVPNLASDPNWNHEPHYESALPSKEAKNALVVPLTAGTKTLGVLGIVNKIGADAFSERDLSLVDALAGEVALAIENACLYEDMCALSVETVRSLAVAIDARDPYTRGHSEGVVQFSLCLTRKLGWSKPDLELLEFAALLHDVGKLAVPDYILRKTEPLNDEEWAIIHKHPAQSALIVKPVKSLKRILPWINHHHECWDGSGYPDGLKGKAIPLAARVIAIADAYDAMTTNRPYRQALPSDQACQELKRGAGTQFDPTLVDIFLKDGCVST
ncbi:MAG: GAF domain-containing protein [Chloroflexi bacterium]|nr:GAF domain-containing protein [Chloroflexota bacterium]